MMLKGAAIVRRGAGEVGGQVGVSLVWGVGWVCKWRREERKEHAEMRGGVGVRAAAWANEGRSGWCLRRRGGSKVVAEDTARGRDVGTEDVGACGGACVRKGRM